MNNPVPYFYINAYPRSGSKFFQTALLIYFDLGQDSDYISRVETDHEVELFADKSKTVITIIRNPKDSIVSTCSINYELGMIKEDEIDTFLDYSVSNWTRYMDQVMVSINRIYPFMFNQVTENVVSCLDKIASTFTLNKNNISNEIVYELYTTLYSGVRATSTNSQKYNTILEKYEKLNNPQKDSLNAAYKEYEKKVLSRQYSLGWYL
jgi:hypothetical protein